MGRRPPLTDPRLRALVAATRRPARGRDLSRRDFLAGVLGTAGVAAALAACSSGTTAPTPSSSARPLTWASWPLYLDQDDAGTSYPTLDAFTEQTGIEVAYREVVEDNAEFTATVAGALAAGSDPGYDLVTLTDWMAATWIRQGWVARLDRSAMPNTANISPSLASVDFDLGRTQSLTWQSGFAGIAWDTRALPKGLRSVSDLWQPALKGRVDVLSEMRDTMGLLLLEDGVDPAGEWDDTPWVAALDVLTEQVASGQVHRVTGNDYTDDLVSGDAVAAIAWSGDIAALNYDEPGRFQFAIPEAGGTLWSDNLLVPAHSPHVADAQRLIDYYYDPEVAATVAAWVSYITPVAGAQEAMAQIDPDLADDPLVFPDDETLARVHVFRTLDAADDERYSGQFSQATGA